MSELLWPLVVLALGVLAFLHARAALKANNAEAEVLRGIDELRRRMEEGDGKHKQAAAELDERVGVLEHRIGEGD